MNRTLSIIKPDAVKRNITGKINAKIEDAGFEIICQKKIHLTKKMAEKFYEIHKDRPFYNDLVEFMTSCPVIVQILQKEGGNIIEDYRNLMGATNPKEAEKDTIRSLYAIDIQNNSIHGSDSIDNAKREIAFFFSEIEILSLNN